MLTYAQERQELLNFLRRAVNYFDREAESMERQVDPAQLYSEGKVVLMRTERELENR